MKNVKKLFSAILFAFALLMVMPAVLPGYSNTVEVNAATKQYTLIKGYVSNTLVADVSTNSNLTWISSNTSVATVAKSSDGKKLTITPRSKGTALIKYKAAGSSKYTTYYVINVATLNKTSLTKSVGGAYTLKLSGVPSGQTVKWSIADDDKDKTVASLSSATSSSVVVTGKNAGNAIVKVTVNGKKQSCTKVKVEAPKLSASSKTVLKGNTFKLAVSNTTQTVTWSSSKTSVATVTSAGKVTAKAKGTAYIYASVGGAKLKCKVTVNTSADYMSALKTTISKSSKVNRAGNHYIGYGTKDSESTYSYYVVYESAKDRLKFIFQRKDIDTASKRSATITMYIYNPSKTYNTTPSLTITTPKGVSFKTKRTFDYRTYSNSTAYKYSITASNVKLTTSRQATMQELSNGYMQKAMKGWNTLLKKNSTSLANIGFAKY